MRETTKAKTTDKMYCVLRDVFNNWQSILCIAISAVLITYIIVSLCYTPKYTSRCTMVISAKENSTGAYTNITETESLTDTIKAVIDSSILKKLAAEQIGASSFDATINVEVLQNTNLLEVSVTSSSPLTSFRLLNAVIDIYPQISKDVLGKIVIQIFEEPDFPSSPSNAFIYKDYIWYAFLLSTLIFATFVSIYSLYSGTVKSEWEISNTLDGKLFGVLYHEPSYKNLRARLRRKRKQLLVGAPMVSFAFSETVKKICTNVIHFHRKTGGNTILVTSYDKHEGKTIVAANLATALTQRKKSVLLISCGESSAQLQKTLNITISDEHCAHTVDDLRDVLYKKDNSLLSILALSDSKIDLLDFSNYHTANGFDAFVTHAKDEYDYIIIDGNCVHNNSNTEHLAKISDFSLLVVKQNHSKATNINDTIDILNRYSNGVCGLVFNNVYSSIAVINSSYHSYGKYSNYGDYGKYSKYGSYGKYGAPLNYADTEISDNSKEG